MPWSQGNWVGCSANHVENAGVIFGKVLPPKGFLGCLENEAREGLHSEVAEVAHEAVHQAQGTHSWIEDQAFHEAGDRLPTF